jgi:predicted RNA-binding protein Jag
VAKRDVVFISVKKSECNIKTTLNTEIDQNKVCKKAEFFLSGLLSKMNVKFSGLQTSVLKDNHFVESFSEGTGILGKMGVKPTKSATVFNFIKF